MINKLIPLIVIAFFLISCGVKSKFSKKETTQQDAAWATMMEVHDRVMPKMNDLYQAGKALKKIAKDNMVAADDTHPRAMEAMKNIEDAEDAMMDWMANIGQYQLTKLRSKDMDHADILALIAKEQTDIEVVEQAMENSLKQGLALIQEKGVTIQKEAENLEKTHK